MKVFINKKETELNAGCTIEQMLRQINASSEHCAVAVGMKVVKKESWSTFELSEHDNITIIKATCGG